MVQKTISKCPACSKTIKAGKEFCIYCGTKLTKQSGTASGARTRLSIPDLEGINFKQLIEKGKKRKS